jgi:Protein of unknown function (DUF664)
MAPTSTMTAEAVALQHFLDAQRATALAILDRLTDEELRTSARPSGWPPLGLIRHLGLCRAPLVPRGVLRHRGRGAMAR